MEALTVTTFQGKMLHHLNANFFILLPLGFGKKCENEFRLDTHKISFVLFMVRALWMSVRPYTFCKNCFFPLIFCLMTLYLCDPMISCLLAYGDAAYFLSDTMDSI